jgi:DNA invertase Pin-like site-specific DNA recombinase
VKAHIPPARLSSATTTRRLRAALYGRASSDPNKRGRSIKDQFAVGELECEDNDWDVVGRYEDRDRSASRRATKERERWNELVADVEADKIDVIVYAERSRATRRMDVFIPLRELCERTGTLLCYGGRTYDMRKPADRREATRDALQAEEEAESTIERNERTARLNARRGAPHGKCQFGYVREYDPATGELIGQAPHIEHAEVVRDLFKRARAREGMVPMLETLRRYRPTATEAGLRRLFQNKAYIGVRVHYNTEYAAAWPAIVDETLFWQVQKIMKAPERRTTPGPTPRHLLTRTGRCGVCVERKLVRPDLRVRKRESPRAEGGFVLRYQCHFGHIVVKRDDLDAYVTEAAHAWLSSPQAVAAFRADVDENRIDGLRARLEMLTAHLAEARQQAGLFNFETGKPLLTVAGLAAIEATTLPTIAEAETELRRLTATQDPVLGELIGRSMEELEAIWKKISVVQRRYVVWKVVRVVVNKSVVRGSLAGRVQLTFAGEPGFDDVQDARGRYAWAEPDEDDEE